MLQYLNSSDPENLKENQKIPSLKYKQNKEKIREYYIEENGINMIIYLIKFIRDNVNVIL